MPSDKIIRTAPSGPATISVPVSADQHVQRDLEVASSVSGTVSQYLLTLRRHKWKLVSFVIACVAGTVIVSSRMTPVYEATATVDIDREVPTGIVGQDARRSDVNDSEQYLATQIGLIQSDSVLRPVAEQYNLREVEHWRVPSAGLDPTRLHDAPVVLKRLRVSRPPNTYLLKLTYRSTDPRLAADVANGIAQSYVQHTYAIRLQSSSNVATFMQAQLDELRAKMERSSAALAKFERDLDLINPEDKTSIISARLLQLNTEYTNAQADRVRKEAIFHLARDGSLNALRTSPQGEPLVKLSEKLNDAEQKFVQTKSHFGAGHPEYKKAAAQLAEMHDEIEQARQDIAQRVSIDYQTALHRELMLRKAVAETKADFDRLNARSFEYQALKREADADKKLYDELIQKIREAGINAGFQSSAVRIADRARPPLEPTSPRVGLNALLAFLLSSLLGFAAIVSSDSLNISVRDPEHITRMLKTEVIGTLPAVRYLRGLRDSGGELGEGGKLSRFRSSGWREVQHYDQAIQTLRNSVMLADFEGRLRSIMVTSASPFEGKSTVVSHLAMATAKRGQRTLLIDADMRRPSVQRVLNVEGERGLADVLSGAADLCEVVVQRDGVENLDILLAGSPSLRSVDLIGPKLLGLIEQAAKSYDLVLLDSPPLHGFPEPLQMATAVDGVMIVAVAGRTNRKLLAASISSIVRLRAHIIGVVLNQVEPNSMENGYYASYYVNNYHPVA